MPVSQMGNYQEYLKRMPSPLREVESAPVRQHMFGNPFKIDKRMMVDEADIDLVSSGSPHRSGNKRGTSEPMSPRPPNKRKPGPIPREVMVRRPVSPAASPPLLPIANTSLPPSLTPAIMNGDIDDLNSLSPEDRARSPSPPPLQPYDECPSLLSSHPYSTPSLGPPPLTLMEDDSPTSDWQPNHISDGFQNHTPHSPPGLNSIKYPRELPLTKTEVAEIKRHNLNVRSLAYKEVRRPGINYAPLFGHLEQMKGSVDVRANVLKDVINESLRFKRRKLANLLDELLQSMLTAGKASNGER